MRFTSGHSWMAAMLAALVARLPGIASKSLWYDEAIAVLLAEKGPQSLIAATVTVEGGVAANVHPLGYFSLLWLWSLPFGTSPLAVRSLSVLIGLGIVAAAYFLARRLFDTRVATLVAWMVALSPFQVHYAQEVRMYGLLGLLLLLAVAMLVSARGELGDWRWLAFAILTAAAQYTHALAGLVLVPLALIPVLKGQWRRVRSVFAWGLVALLLYLPWLLLLPNQIGRVQRAYWIGRPGAAELVRTPMVLLGGSPLPSWGIPIVLFSLLLLVFVSLQALIRARRAADPGASTSAWAAYLAVVPWILMFLISLWQPIYIDRAMLPSGVAALFLLAWVLGSRYLDQRFRWTAAAGLIASFAVGLIGFYTYRGFPYAPYQEVINYLRSNAANAEVLVHSNKLTALPSIYYAPDLPQPFVADPAGSSTDTLAPATQAALGLEAAPDISSAVGQSEGVWFAIFGREIREYAAIDSGPHPSLGWLRENFAREELHPFGDLELHHFWERIDAQSDDAAARAPSLAEVP